jgi:hypothetical protein
MRPEWTIMRLFFEGGEASLGAMKQDLDHLPEGRSSSPGQRVAQLPSGIVRDICETRIAALSEAAWGREG